MKFRIGDKTNNVETSEQTIEANSYVKALEKLVEDANLYCEPIDEEGEENRDLFYTAHIYKKILQSIRDLLDTGTMDDRVIVSELVEIMEKYAPGKER